MKRKVILIILVFLFNIVWVNAITGTNNLLSHYNIVIVTNKKPSLNNNIIEDLDVMLGTDLTYNDEDSSVIGKKINNFLKSEMEGYGELIARYSIAYEVDPYLVASMIIESTNCDSECSVLVRMCNNVSKDKYDETNELEMSCLGGSYQKFNSIEDSIKTFVKYVKLNFFDNELKTPSSIYKSYKKDVRWVFIVNQYIDKIKNSSVQ